MERQIIDQYVSTGEVRFEYRHYIVVDSNVGGSESRRAAEAAECAEDQGEFWNYNAMVFANWNGEGRGAFADRRLKAFAQSLGLDMGEFNACFDGGRTAARVREDQALGQSRGVSGTPTIFVNQTRIKNPLDFSEFQQVIESELAR